MRPQPPFRAEHIGSLLRPKRLREAHRRHAEGALADAALHAVQDDCVREVVRMQEEAGMQAVTDGEFRRASYWMHFVAAIDGFAIGTAAFKFQDDSGEQSAFTCPEVTRKLARKHSASADEYGFLASVTTRTPKITMPSPSTLHFWRGRTGLPADAYRDDAAFFADLTAIYRAEIADLARAGCRYIQIDEVPIVMLCDPHVREQVCARGEDPEALVAQYIAAINEAVKDRPADMVAGVHMCRGNYKGRWLSEGGYDGVAERLFSEANVDVFFLEYDTARAGDFAPLRFLPRHKHAVLGLVSSKVAALEDRDALRRRLDEASRIVPLDRLGLSPQCGFASAAGGNPVTEDVQRAKLRLCCDVARAVW